MIILRNVHLKDDPQTSEEDVSFSNKVSSKLKQVKNKVKKVFGIGKVGPDGGMQFDANHLTPGANDVSTNGTTTRNINLKSQGQDLDTDDYENGNNYDTGRTKDEDFSKQVAASKNLTMNGAGNMQEFEMNNSVDTRMDSVHKNQDEINSSVLNTMDNIN